VSSVSPGSAARSLLITPVNNFFTAQQPPLGHGLIIEALWSHLRHTSVGRTPLDEWSVRRRDLYLTTHNNHEDTDIHSAGGIQTRNPSRPAASDPRLRPCGHCDRPASYLPLDNCLSVHNETISNCNKLKYQNFSWGTNGYFTKTANIRKILGPETNTAPWTESGLPGI